MEVKNTLMKFAGGLGIAVSLVLSGCAHVQTAEDPPPSAAASPSEETLPDYASMNPVPIVFDKMSVKLRDSEKQILAQIKDRAQRATTLIITGYCDRRQVGNPKAAAIARAVAVKEELVRMGVKPATVKIQHVTDVANKHAAEIELYAAI